MPNEEKTPEPVPKSLFLGVFELARSMGTQEDLDMVNKIIGGNVADDQLLPQIQVVFTA